MADIKAIETIYNGYRFRSRLEARWAVFFGSCGIKYEYEPEGYILENGTKYLPDFLIRDCATTPFSAGDLYIEVKPCKPTEEEKNRALLLSKGVESSVLIVSQIPKMRYFEKGEAILHYTRNEKEIVRDCIGLQTVSNWDFDDTWHFSDGVDYGCGIYVDVCKKPVHAENHNARLVLGLDVIWSAHSYNRARQARFEHGEKG